MTIAVSSPIGYILAVRNLDGDGRSEAAHWRVLDDEDASAREAKFLWPEPHGKDRFICELHYPADDSAHWYIGIIERGNRRQVARYEIRDTAAEVQLDADDIRVTYPEHWSGVTRFLICEAREVTQ